jgi:hypothetical protein
LNVTLKYKQEFDGGKFYSLHTTPAADGKSDVSNEISFDGERVYMGHPGRNDFKGWVTRARVDDPTDSIRSIRLVNFGYLEASGFYAPATMAEMRDIPGIDSLVLHDVAQSETTKVETSDGKLRVTVLIPDAILLAAQKLKLKEEEKKLKRSADLRASDPRFTNFPAIDVAKEMEALKRQQQANPKRKISFLLDPARGYAVVEREDWTAAGQRISRIEPGEWTHYQERSLWWPKRCVATYYTIPLSMTTFSDQPMLTITYELGGLSFRGQGAPAQVEYALDKTQEYLQAGTHVMDRNTPGALKNPNHEAVYVVQPDGKALRNRALEASAEAHRIPRLIQLALVAMLVVPLGWTLLARQLKRG